MAAKATGKGDPRIFKFGSFQAEALDEEGRYRIIAKGDDGGPAGVEEGDETAVVVRRSLVTPAHAREEENGGSWTVVGASRGKKKVVSRVDSPVSFSGGGGSGDSARPASLPIFRGSSMVDPRVRRAVSVPVDYKEQLAREIAQLFPFYTSEEKRGFEDLFFEQERCVRLYQNIVGEGIDSALQFMFLGASSLRDDTTLIENVGLVSTYYDRRFAHRIGFNARIDDKYKYEPESEEKTTLLRDTHNRLKYQGAILHESRWWLLPNDVTILGAIHAEKDFIIPNIPLENLLGRRGVGDSRTLWDFRTQRPTALGRELLMLSLAGYRLSKTSRASHERSIARGARPEPLYFVHPDGHPFLTLSEFKRIYDSIVTESDSCEVFFGQIQELYSH